MPKAQVQPQRQPIPILDRILAAWEDFWYMVAFVRTRFGYQGRPQMCSPIGAVLNWQRFRQFLLTFHKDGKDPSAFSTIEPFLLPPDLPQSLERDFLQYWFPVWLLNWSAHSRRLYQVSDDLQLVLRATSLRDIRWKDVRFPFPAFALSLPRPISDRNGVEFDFVTALLALLPGGGRRTQAVDGHYSSIFS